MIFHDGFIYSLKSWHLLFAPRKILVAHSGLGPWAVRNVPASRAFKSGLTTKQTGIYWDFTNKNTGNIMGIWNMCVFYSKMTLLGIQATDMPFQWIYSMD